MKDFWKKISTSDIRNVLAVMYVSLVLAYIYVLVFKPVPSENKDLVNIIGGNVIGGLGVVLGYYFGASKRESDASEKPTNKP